MDSLNHWFDVVSRTANQGLEEAPKNRVYFDHWFCLWSMGLVGEIKEAIDALNENGNDQKFYQELGDVYYYICAGSLILGNFDPHYLFGKDPSRFFNNEEFDPYLQSTENKLYRVLFLAIDRLELVKKIVRDGRELTSDVKVQLYQNLQNIFFLIESLGKMDYAVNLVDQKLRKRYPQGYSSDRSINRIE